MAHIRYIQSINTNTYTVVISEGFGGENQPPLSQHQSIIEHPELFEVSDDEIPECHQFLQYVSDINP